MVLIMLNYMVECEYFSCVIFIFLIMVFLLFLVDVGFQLLTLAIESWKRHDCFVQTLAKFMRFSRKSSILSLRSV